MKGATRSGKFMSIRIQYFYRYLPALMLALAMTHAHAGDDYIVYSPHVDKGELEVEARGYRSSDADKTVDGCGMAGLALAYSPLSWWKTELYAGPLERDPVAGTHFRGVEWENFIQLAEKGEHWVDTGLLLAYAHNNNPATPNSLELGALFQKDTPLLLNRLNLIWEKPSGVDFFGKFNFRAAYAGGVRLWDAFAPGVEAFYRPNDNSRQVGPAFSGKLKVGHEQALEYSAALVYGINHWGPEKTFILRASLVFE
jgi:hypothetical protein